MPVHSAPQTNSRVFFSINQRLSFTCLKLIQVCLLLLQYHWAHSLPPPVLCRSLCFWMCAHVWVCLAVYLLHFFPCHSFSYGCIKAQKASTSAKWYESVRPITWSSQSFTANRIINFVSKESQPGRVKRGELWREHALMSFMTLQIMH